MTEPESAAWSDPQFSLMRAVPGRWHKRLAGGLLALLCVAAAAAWPYAQVPLRGSEPFVAVYATAIFVNDLITAVLLFSLASVAASRAILALAAGYLFLALTTVPWALTFPGALAPGGLIDAGLQGTATLSAVRRLGFPLFVIAYVALRKRDRSTKSPHGRTAAVATVLATTAAVALVCALVLADHGLLPRFMRDSRHVASAWGYVAATAAALYALSLLLVLSGRRSVLDIWLAVVVVTLLIELVLLSYISGGNRLSVGWWTGRAFGFVSASVVLFVLLAETTTLYARLARSILMERRAQDARMATLEAFSASVAHEVSQPLASMVTNADAGLRWLDRPEPDVNETRAALTRVVREGHRAGEIVQGIRSLFRTGHRQRQALDPNEVVAAVLRDFRSDMRAAGTVLETDLAAGLPAVAVNRVQLEQVIANLVANALEAMQSVAGPRVLRVTSAADADGGVRISVADTGIGLGTTDPDTMFEPFVTTKPHGLGMGLMLCRSIVEAHGGRLSARPAVARGAVFTFSLPASLGELKRASGS